MRGEDASSIATIASVLETPPHAWGRPGERTRWRLSYKKHPHMRGEDHHSRHDGIFQRETPPHAWGRHMDGDASLDDWETPPHAWGRRAYRHPGPRYSRNTPTCEGKTQVQVKLTRLLQKHPHMRGEDQYYIATSKTTLETPPHAWGRP